MVSQPRRNTLVVLVVALTGAVLVSGIPLYSVTPSPGVDAGERDLVALDESGPYVWPYTASGPRFDRAVSPINVVFAADPATVRRTLRDRAEGPWNVSQPGEEAPEHVESGLPWQQLESQDRFVYVADAPGGQGEWRRPEYQLHSGDYFGQQFHLRVYDASRGGSEWTVIQAHGEHWDWFTLTHHVDSVEQPRIAIEDQFITAGDTIVVERQYFRNGDSFDGDGWTTVIHLAVLLVVPATIPASRLIRRIRTPTTRRLALFGAAGAILLGVRVAGIVSESLGLPHAIVSKVLYVVLILGTPATVAVFGRRLPNADAFALAAIGFALAVFIDYMSLTVGVLPISLFIHRMVASVAVGAVAASGFQLNRHWLQSNTLWALSLLLWACVVVIPLL